MAFPAQALVLAAKGRVSMPTIYDIAPCWHMLVQSISESAASGLCSDWNYPQRRPDYWLLLAGSYQEAVRYMGDGFSTGAGCRILVRQEGGHWFAVILQVKSSQFTSGMNSKARLGIEQLFTNAHGQQVGLQIKGIVLANLHLFKKAQAGERVRCRSSTLC